MKVLQFIKSLNNTELGKSGTNESYVLVPQKTKSKVEVLFNGFNPNDNIINLINGTTISSIHVTNGREFRINGLGTFYRENNVNAGDEVVFERREDENGVRFFINLNIKQNAIVFQKNSKGFEILTKDRLTVFTFNDVYYNNELGIITINFKNSERKNINSPSNTDFYTLNFNGNDLINELKSDEYFMLSTLHNRLELKKILVWQFYEFKTQ
jgi:hypothetical protein